MKFLQTTLSLWLTLVIGYKWTIAQQAASDGGNRTNSCGNNTYCLQYIKIQKDIENISNGVSKYPLRDITHVPTQRQKLPRNNSNCPFRVRQSGKISERSLSPWRWIRNFDANRLPQVILEAECLCQHCIDLSQPGKLNRSLLVDQIVVRVPVQRHGALRVIQITVGCRCKTIKKN